jgi:hypothetical protein
MAATITLWHELFDSLYRLPIADSQDLLELKAYYLRLLASLAAATPRTVFSRRSTARFVKQQATLQGPRAGGV